MRTSLVSLSILSPWCIEKAIFYKCHRTKKLRCITFSEQLDTARFESPAILKKLAISRRRLAELGDATLKKIAHELAESLRQSVSVDWAVRDNVRAKLRLLVKRILRKYKYPPVRQDEAIQMVLDQAESLCAEWA